MAVKKQKFEPGALEEINREEAEQEDEPPCRPLGSGEAGSGGKWKRDCYSVFPCDQRWALVLETKNASPDVLNKASPQFFPFEKSKYFCVYETKDGFRTWE